MVGYHVRARLLGEMHVMCRRKRIISVVAERPGHHVAALMGIISHLEKAS